MAKKMQTCLVFFIVMSAWLMTKAAEDVSTNCPDQSRSCSSVQDATSSDLMHSDWSIQTTSVPGNSMLIGQPDSASLTSGRIHPSTTQSTFEALHELNKVNLSATHVMRSVVSSMSHFENSVPFFSTKDNFAPFTSMFKSELFSMPSTIAVQSSIYSNKLYVDSNHQSSSSNMDAFNTKLHDNIEFVMQDYSHDVIYSSRSNMESIVAIPGASSYQLQSSFLMSELSSFSSVLNDDFTSSLSIQGMQVSSSKDGHNTTLLSSSSADMQNAINEPFSSTILYESKEKYVPTSSVLSLSSSDEISYSLTDVAISTNSFDVSYQPNLRTTMPYSVLAASSELQDSWMSTTNDTPSGREILVSIALSANNESLKETSYSTIAISATDILISKLLMTDNSIKASIFPSQVQTDATHTSIEISLNQESEIVSSSIFEIESSSELSGMIQSSVLSSIFPSGGVSDDFFDDVSMTMANITKSMAWFSAEMASTVTSGLDENMPHLQHPIGIQLVAMGTFWEYPIPHDTFRDERDGDTRNLTLSLASINSHLLPPWIMFKEQVIYALPLPADAVQSPVQLTLSATNSKGFSSNTNFQIYLHSSSVDNLTHLITITFDTVYNVFMKQRDNAIMLTHRLESYFGEYGVNTIRIINIAEGSLVISWTNNSISTSVCDKKAIKSMYEWLLNPNENLTSVFRAYMHPEYIVLSVNLEYKGICVNETNDGTTDATISERGIWIEIFVPTFIIILVCVLVCLIVFIKKRRRAVGEDVLLKVEKGTFMREREPIIFPEEIEIIDSAVRPKHPIVLSAEMLEPHETSIESGHSEPPSYTTDDPNMHHSGVSNPPMYPGSERPSPPPYRLPPLYIVPTAMQGLYS